MGFLKVGKGIPEFTPVEMPLAGYLNREGISYASLKQEPRSSGMRGCQFQTMTKAHVKTLSTGSFVKFSGASPYSPMA